MRSQRLLSILMQLQVSRRVTAKDLAERLEVSERTILRDMDALSASGIPVVAERGAGGGWSLLEEYETKLNGLSPEEIQSLFLSGPPKLLADLGLKQASDHAWTKLQAALPARSRSSAQFLRQRVLIDPRGWRDASESVACLPVLLDALWRERQVRFLYERSGCEASERTVDPLGLVARGSVWYLIAKRDGDIRTYRVSRIRDPQILESRVDGHKDFNLSAYWERSATEFRSQLPQYHATFLVKPSVLRWVRYKGWRLQAEEPYGAQVKIRIRFDAEEEAVQFALSFGGDLEVVDPVELRALVLESAHEIVSKYSE
jgi:predicted DNA-binding transcriptional regulator YafY